MEHYQWAEEQLQKIRKKMDLVSDRNRNKIPYTTDENGRYDDKSDMTRTWDLDDGLNWWTNGFWAGIMWMLYIDTQEEKYKEIARISEKKLEECFHLFYGLHHDVGFMYLPTAVMDYRITGNEESRKIGMHAANLLAGRFNSKGKFIRAWNGVVLEDTRGWAIIDCMFNISLLYWASREDKDPRFKQIAMMHADTVMHQFIRDDGSSSHIVVFDPETGEKMHSLGGQGYDAESAWTRGQGWALYGFTNSYANTGKEEYLETAVKVADYCIANIPQSGIIPVDFRQPEDVALEDSCGACVIAGGLIELSKYVNIQKKELYLNKAVHILQTIANFRADFSEQTDAIVQNCTGAYYAETHHFTMVYADYYFIEALYKLRQTDFLLW